jgi:DNA-binding transcriptional regulator YhcF (GntR family)
MAVAKRPEQYMKYQSIKADLHKALENGTYRVGHKLPSERNLAEKFGASVMTVRQALSLMSQEGMIERVPGRGSFVLDPNPSFPSVQASSCTTVALLTIDNPCADPFRSDATANTDNMIWRSADIWKSRGNLLLSPIPPLAIWLKAGSQWPWRITLWAEYSFTAW